MIGEEVIAYYGDAGDGAELFEVQKLVRCKDCKCWLGDSEWYEDREYKRCQNGGLLTSLNHYCAWGERSEE